MNLIWYFWGQKFFTDSLGGANINAPLCISLLVYREYFLGRDKFTLLIFINLAVPNLGLGVILDEYFGDTKILSVKFGLIQLKQFSQTTTGYSSQLVWLFSCHQPALTKLLNGGLKTSASAERFSHRMINRECTANSLMTLQKLSADLQQPINNILSHLGSSDSPKRLSDQCEKHRGQRGICALDWVTAVRPVGYRRLFHAGLSRKAGESCLLFLWQKGACEEEDIQPSKDLQQ